jgi:methylenetetrahydrofolate reductase (NADPH)
LKAALEKGQFVVTCELAPPKGTDASELRAHARLLRGRVHAANVTDNQRAVMRMSSWAAARLLLDEGLEPICQLTCRDRNRLGLQSDLLGVHALGVRNVLLLGGDPARVGDHPEAKDVMDLDALRLLGAVKSLNEGKDLAGNALGGATELFPAAALSPEMGPVEKGLENMRAKVAAGARFFQTQPLNTPSALVPFVEEAKKLGVWIVAGVFLVKSAKNAAFLNKNVPGFRIPDAVIARFEAAADPLAEGIKMCAESIEALRPIAHGVHVMAVKAEEKIPEILSLTDVKVLPAIQ